MEKEKKIYDCKSRRFHNLIIGLLEQKKPYALIAKRVGMTTSYISKIAKKNNLKYKVVRADIKRNNKINKLILNGLGYEVIAKKFHLTNQRIQQLAKRIGVSRWENSRAYYKNIANKINSDIIKGVSYKKIQKKYNTKKNISFLYKHGLNPLPSFFREKRNKAIVSDFINGKSAIEITKLKDKALKDPVKLKCISSIYRITKKAGILRYPEVGNRRDGIVFEKREILYLIKLYREKRNYTYEKIADTLNKKGYKTLTGKNFYGQIVFAKYKIAKSLK